MSTGRVSESRYTLQQVNELSNYIRIETLKSLNDPTAVPQKFIDTNFFAKQLEYKVVQSRLGRERVRGQGTVRLPKEVVNRVAAYLKKEAKSVSLEDVLTFRNADLARIAGVDEADVRRMKLEALGVTFKSESSKNDDGASKSKRK
jgi:hypothetical protein